MTDHPLAATLAQIHRLDYVPGELDRTAPPRIWLQIDTGGSNDDRDESWPGADGVTWQDEQIGGLEIEYVRADLAALPGGGVDEDAVRIDMTPHMQTGKIDDQTVEMAITAAMGQARIEGFGLCSDKWDTSFPTRSMWRAALTAALNRESENG